MDMLLQHVYVFYLREEHNSVNQVEYQDASNARKNMTRVYTKSLEYDQYEIKHGKLQEHDDVK